MIFILAVHLISSLRKALSKSFSDNQRLLPHVWRSIAACPQAAIRTLILLGKSSPVQQNSDLQKLWNYILDKQMVELNTRFKPDTYGFMRAAAACLPRSDTFGDKALRRLFHSGGRCRAHGLKERQRPTRP